MNDRYDFLVLRQLELLPTVTVCPTINYSQYYFSQNQNGNFLTNSSSVQVKVHTGVYQVLPVVVTVASLQLCFRWRRRCSTEVLFLCDQYVGKDAMCTTMAV